jgi:hypothetical protein
MAMLKFIADVEGATTRDVQAYMLLNFGIKNKTAVQYLHECHLAGSLVLTQDQRWIVTEKFFKYLR